ncbi:MAG: acyl carrier protein [Planctomycetes bacterium]|nr:acyl carrier protein [Planctomycetota bacterium]
MVRGERGVEVHDVEGIGRAINEFILENFLFSSDPGSIDGNTSFLEMAIVDSTGILEIVSFLEETFGIKVEDEEIIPENLDSIQKLVAYTKKKLCLV